MNKVIVFDTDKGVLREGLCDFKIIDHFFVLVQLGNVSQLYNRISVCLDTPANREAIQSFIEYKKKVNDDLYIAEIKLLQDLKE